MAAGYSPLPNLFIAGSFFTLHGRKDQGADLRGYLFNGRAGAPFSFSFPTSTHHKVFLITNLSCGYSRGQAKSINTNLKSEFDFQKLFGQFSVGIRYGIFQIDAFAKYNRIQYLDGEVSVNGLNNGFFEITQIIEAESEFDSYEIKLQAAAGLEIVKVNFGMSFESTFSFDYDLHLNFINGGGFYLGLTFYLHKINST